MDCYYHGYDIIIMAMIAIDIEFCLKTTRESLGTEAACVGRGPHHTAAYPWYEGSFARSGRPTGHLRHWAHHNASCVILGHPASCVIVC